MKLTKVQKQCYWHNAMTVSKVKVLLWIDSLFDYYLKYITLLDCRAAPGGGFL